MHATDFMSKDLCLSFEILRAASLLQMRCIRTCRIFCHRSCIRLVISRCSHLCFLLTYNVEMLPFSQDVSNDRTGATGGASSLRISRPGNGPQFLTDDGTQNGRPLADMAVTELQAGLRLDMLRPLPMPVLPAGATDQSDPEGSWRVKACKPCKP